MWVDISSSRFAELQPMLEFPNPEAEKQKKLQASGVVKWARYINPLVRLYARREDPQVISVPMGAAWSSEREHWEVAVETALKGMPWLMPHQKQAIADVACMRSGIIVAPCGAGKTQMGLGLHQVRKAMDGPTLILVHTRDLAKQWQDRFVKVLGWSPFMALGAFEFEQCAEKAQTACAGRCIVTTFQTLAKVKEGVGLRHWEFGTLIVDEAHHAPAKMFQDVLMGLRCRRVYGLTATPNREDGWTPAMLAWLGPIRHTVSAAHLQAIGLTMSPTVCKVETGFHSWSGDFTTIVSDLLEMHDRNALIVKMVERHGDWPQLVLTSRVEHAEKLASLIPESVSVVGRTRGRAEAFAAVREGRAKVLIATQLADEGLDVPELVAVHMVAPSRAAGRVIQRIGRVMRSAPGKSRPTVYDYVDDMSLLASQWRSRAKACRDSLPGVRFTVLKQGELP